MATAVDIIISSKDAATKTLKKVEGTIKDISKAAEDFANKHEDSFQKAAVAGTAAFVGIAAVAKQTIDAYAESEAQLARVDAALRNVDYSKMWSSFEEAAAKAREFGDSLQASVGIGGEAAAESYAKLVQVTGDYAEAQKLAGLAADLSVAKQISMDSATKLVTMALAGNTKILKEYGIELDEGATKQQVIGAIMEKVGWQAQAFWQTTAGQTAIMNESFGDLQETIGQALVPAFNQMMAAALPLIRSFTKWAADNQELVAVIVKISLVAAGLVAGLGTLGLAIIPIISGINAAISAFGMAITVVKALGTALTFLAANPIGIVITVLAALAAALYYVYKNWDEIRPKLLALWTTIGGSISYAVEAAKDAVGSAMDWMQSKVSQVTEWLAAKVNDVLGFAKTIRNALADVWGAVSGAVSSAGAAVGATIAGARADGWPVSSGKTYLVGERGPELFTPSRSGTIIPNGSAAGGSGGVTLNVSIGSVDASDKSQVDRLMARLKNELTRELRLAKVWIS